MNYQSSVDARFSGDLIIDMLGLVSLGVFDLIRNLDLPVFQGFSDWSSS